MCKFLSVVILSVDILMTSAPIVHLHYCSPSTECTELSNCLDKFRGLKTIKGNFCGFGENALKICCSNVNDLTSTTAIQVFDWDKKLVGHENFKLLPVDKCGVVSSRLRITLGDKTSPGEFPWMALIAYKTGNSRSQQDFKCGGTLITERYILTAAHCTYNSTVIGIRLGEYNVLTETDCDSDGHNCIPPVQDCLIDKIISHPLYDPSTFINDIALIKLATPVDCSYENVKPICLPFGDVVLDNSEMIVTGWGATEQGNKSTILRKVSVPIIPISTCRQLYASIKPISANQICAGADKGRDSCAGDSGGPLKRIDSINKTPRYVQYGVVSFGPTRCGLSGRPGIYTNVPKYMRWILDNLE